MTILVKQFVRATAGFAALGVITAVVGCERGHHHDDERDRSQQQQQAQQQPYAQQQPLNSQVPSQAVVQQQVGEAPLPQDVQEPQSIIVENEPPPVIVEQQPVAPGPDYVWVNGYWNWDSLRYRWEPGRYVRPPQAGAVWLGPRYERDAHGVRYTRPQWRAPARDAGHDRDHK